MENKKQIRTINIASFADFIADPDRYRMKQEKDYSIQGVRTSSKIVKLVKKTGRDR